MTDTPTNKWRAIRVLAGIAIVICSYLLVTSIRGGHVAGCGPATGCEDVLRSPWAYWMGLPISLPALLLYASLFAGTFWATSRTPAARREETRTFLSWAACLILVAAAWFLA